MGQLSKSDFILCWLALQLLSASAALPNTNVAQDESLEEVNGVSSMNHLRQRHMSHLERWLKKTKETPEPTPMPTDFPTFRPTGLSFFGSFNTFPDSLNSTAPSIQPSSTPTMPPYLLSTPPPGVFTYQPGNLTTFKDLLWLSEGLDSKLLARSGFPVKYHDGDFSEAPFHFLPDGAGCFADPREENQGGWILVSNSEVRSDGLGGAGAVTFDSEGNIIHYQMVLENTKSNCGGGKTPWGTWVSCEETPSGNLYQVDPTGVREPEMLTLGSEGGQWESFTVDVRDLNAPAFYVTEDMPNGTLARFIPKMKKHEDVLDVTDISWWDILHGKGDIQYLLLEPDSDNPDAGTFSWTDDRIEAANNALLYYPSTEGMDMYKNELYFICKGIKMLYSLDMDTGTYSRTTTLSGLFDGQPDTLNRILQDDAELLYFTEDVGTRAGVHARDGQGRYFTILESTVLLGETAGLAFSPDGKTMYVSYQSMGRLYAIWRRDGFPFYGVHLDVTYHDSTSN